MSDFNQIIMGLDFLGRFMHGLDDYPLRKAFRQDGTILAFGPFFMIIMPEAHGLFNAIVFSRIGLNVLFAFKFDGNVGNAKEPVYRDGVDFIDELKRLISAFFNFELEFIRINDELKLLFSLNKRIVVQ